MYVPLLRFGSPSRKGSDLQGGGRGEMAVRLFAVALQQWNSTTGGITHPYAGSVLDCFRFHILENYRFIM